MSLVLPYRWLDVFAVGPFSGNQLCVFSGADDLPVTLMQRITREINHSETTFLQRPAGPGRDCRIRILLPSGSSAEEVPFAGHPILGSACVAAADQRRRSTVTCETGVGSIPVTVTPLKEGLWEARMPQPVPRLVRTLSGGTDLAAALGLEPDDVRTDLPVEAVYNGMSTVLIPLRSVEAVQRARPELGRLRAILGRDGSNTMLFALGGLTDGAHVHCRVFSPFDLVVEDPATGSANGPLGEYLVRHGALALPSIQSEQGMEIGRPSRLTIEVERNGGQTQAVFVSGRVQLIGQGEFRL